MSDPIACPACGRLLQMPGAAPGQEARCSACGETFTLDDPGSRAIQSAPLEHRPGQKEDRYADEPGAHPPLRSRDWSSDVDALRSRMVGPLPGGELTKALVLLLALNVFVSLMTVVVELIWLAESGQPRGTFTDGAEVGRQMMAGVVPLVFFPTAIVFFVWMYRSYKNLIDLGVQRLEYSPGWAVGAFFVPIISLYRPLHIAQEMWRASTPGLPPDEPLAWRKTFGSVRIMAWWLLYLSILLWGVFHVATVADPTNERNIAWSVKVGAVGETLFACAGVLALLMVRGIRARQVKKAQNDRA